MTKEETEAAVNVVKNWVLTSPVGSIPTNEAKEALFALAGGFLKNVARIADAAEELNRNLNKRNFG